jgi:hypothetical protein
VREFGDNQYRVFDHGRNGSNDCGFASGNDHFLDFSHGDDQRLADGGRRVYLHGNDSRGLRRCYGHWLYHGNSQ